MPQFTKAIVSSVPVKAYKLARSTVGIRKHVADAKDTFATILASCRCPTCQNGKRTGSQTVCRRIYEYAEDGIWPNQWSSSIETRPFRRDIRCFEVPRSSEHGYLVKFISGLEHLPLVSGYPDVTLKLDIPDVTKTTYPDLNVDWNTQVAAERINHAVRLRKNGSLPHVK